MFRFIESICFEDYDFPLLKQHQERVNRTFENFYPGQKPFDLNNLLSFKEMPQDGDRYKVRIVYNEIPEEFSITKYSPKSIDSLKLIETPSFDYSFKFENRENLSQLNSLKESAQDIIIVIDGKVTDSSYSNLLFKKKGVYYTPETPLLAGTRRQYLLENGHITEKDINVGNIDEFESVCLINAMLKPGEIEIPIENIIR
ncbi:aminotransferase class IV [Mangrovivirga sp. M17]|uniref:Aminotransferase class IV n=1 Tax=Mangrovivirga halotolerans TaxID=2993936 RepID=A0ABT3RMT3_9BACT|nr:aminotransferase class IV [Mangrovivirga halotolerans]MCX2742917.1 aminotransferase class IV [Mangrovivirga halotolerans]